MNEEDEFNEPEPIFDRDYSNIIIVDGIPRIPASKITKLKSFITKTFKDYGNIVEVDVPGPEEEGKKAKSPGYAMIEFASKEMAAAALKAKDGARFDKKHTMQISLYSDVDEIMNVTEEYTPPEKTEYKTESKNFDGWTTDDFGRDQLAIRFAKETHIVWNDPIRKNNDQDKGIEMFYDGGRQKQAKRRGACWTESYTAWSPKGTYLATFHDQGILIWGGPDFQEIARFEHRGVSAIDFSPCENFIVTANWKDRKTAKQPDCFIVWDIKKKILCGKRGPAEGQFVCRGFNKEMSNTWPAFQWSPDDKYFSRVGKDVINVYETPSFKLLNRKRISIPGIQEASWSPKSNVIAYWIPEKKNHPATVALREIPSGKLLREKHLYSVFNIVMYWQQAGDYLCVKLSRRISKKTFTTNFELFRMNAKNIPVEVIEMKDPAIIDFQWQPRQHMFSVVHAPQPQGKPTVTFYQVKKKKTAVALTLTDRNIDTVRWAPAGTAAVLAHMSSGKLEFFDVKRKEVLAETDHFKCTSIEWDPSGRYLLSISAQPLGESSWAYASENGYKIWTFQGELLTNCPKETLYQVMWRPRPPTMLSKQQIADTKKNLRKKYWDRFEAEMSKIRQSTSSAADKERLRIKEEWKKFRKLCDQSYVADSEARRELRGADSDNEDDWEVQETTVQTLISITEEPL